MARYPMISENIVAIGIGVRWGTAMLGHKKIYENEQRKSTQKSL